MSLCTWPIILAFVVSLILVALRGRWPFGAFNVIVHELSHGLVGIASGGFFDRFEMNLSGDGRAFFKGVLWGCAVFPAGYVGSAFFGGLLLLGANRPGWSRPLTFWLGLILALLTFVFAFAPFLSSIYGISTDGHPSIRYTFLALLSGFVFAAILIWVAIKGSEQTAAFVLNILAFQCFFNTVAILWDLRQAPCPESEHDACKMAQSTHISASCWLYFWLLITLVFLLVCLLLIGRYY